MSLSEDRAGFTLIEALIALAVIGVCLSAIGALMAANLRAVRQVDQRLALVSALRKVQAALPDRANLGDDLTGELGGQSFSIGSTPFPDPSPPPFAGKDPPAWTPRAIVIRVQGDSGSMIEVQTLRLVPSSTQ